MSKCIGVIGLGYVGMPLAVEFSRHFDVVGFDIKRQRVQELSKGYDRTGEIDFNRINSQRLQLTFEPKDLDRCNVFIVTVPTPITQNKQPDFVALLSATNMIAQSLKRGDIVIYESTVYPGCTEEVCVPVLEKESGLKFNTDFFCGYSPERMNPGDKARTVDKIIKVTSGSTPAAAKEVDELYKKIVTAGTHLTSSIRVAEAAKAIENAQRDINIAFVNELAVIFNLLGVDTTEVLEAAGTKWNFVRFKPGLVGGHCIGVDPFYLTYKAEAVGYHPEVILSGRRINDNMGAYIAGRVMKLMLQRLRKIEKPRVLILGMTFKENCPDVRNSKVIDIYKELNEFGCEVNVYDPLANPDEVHEEYNFHLSDASVMDKIATYHAAVFAVAHDQFKELKIVKRDFPNTILYDVKGIFDLSQVDARL